MKYHIRFVVLYISFHQSLFSGLDACRPAVNSFTHLQYLPYPKVRQQGYLLRCATVQPVGQLFLLTFGNFPAETVNCIALTVPGCCGLAVSYEPHLL